MYIYSCIEFFLGVVEACYIIFSMPNYCLHLKVTVYVCMVINTPICLSQVRFSVPVLLMHTHTYIYMYF